MNKTLHPERKRIVVVGERTHVTRDLQRHLVSLGYDVPVTVDAGKETVAVVAAFQPVLIAVDLAFGRMSALHAARQMRAQLTVRLLFISDRLDQDQVLHAARIHPNAILSRPYTSSELEFAVLYALASKHPRVADR